MSAQHPNPLPEPGARGSQQPVESQAGEKQLIADTHLQVDPLQSFREYSSPIRGQVSGAPSMPVYPVPGYNQSGNPGQATGVLGYYQPGNPQATGVPAYYQPGNPGQATGVPGYTPYAGQVPGAWPGYAPYAGYAGQIPGAPGQIYPGYNPYMQYAGYPGYGYGWPAMPAQPKRDTYLLVVGIVAFACSCLVILGGLGSLGLIGLFDLASSSTTAASSLSGSTFFASIILLLTFAIAGLAGGGFCMYHSIRSLFLRKTSQTIWLPRFWIFLLCYLATLGIGFWLQESGVGTSSPVLMGVLIYLGAIFPALAILALGIRRLSVPKLGAWPTSWRRLTLALVSGATLSIALASLLEFVLELVMLGSQSTAVTQYISDPNAGNPPSSLYGVLLILLSVIAPLVEELVKPLAVVVLIGRVRSKAEAFTLGLACGIGFNLVETTGYISSGYNDWLNVALVRSGAGLLHGFGAAMVSLGWYYLTHKEEGVWQKRALVAFGCGMYAVLQHALWNGSVGLVFLPGPLGSFFQNWSWNLGTFQIDATELVNIAEMVGILLFFLYMSGRLRTGGKTKKGGQATESTRVAPV